MKTQGQFFVKVLIFAFLALFLSGNTLEAQTTAASLKVNFINFKLSSDAKTISYDVYAQDVDVAHICGVAGYCVRAKIAQSYLGSNSKTVSVTNPNALMGGGNAAMDASGMDWLMKFSSTVPPSEWAAADQISATFPGTRLGTFNLTNTDGTAFANPQTFPIFYAGATTLTKTTLSLFQEGTNNPTVDATDPISINLFNGIGTDAANPTTYILAAAAPTISYTTPQNYTYGAAITALTPSVTGWVDNYSISSALPAGLSFNTATGAISGTPTVVSTSTTYTITATNSAGSGTFDLTLAVNPKALTMTGLTVAASKPYDGTLNATVVGTPALQSGEAIGTGNATDGKPFTGEDVSLTGLATGTYNSANVATASTVTFGGLSLTGAQAANYTLTIQGPASATVTKAVLTITANAKTVTFGDPVSNVTGTGSYSVLGYKNGENSSVITGSVSYTTSYTATTAAGTSGLTITPDISALTAANYSFSGATGTVTVDKAVLTITADNQSVAYGTSVATVTTGGTNTPTGFAGSDDATVISGLVSYTTSYTATTAAGTSGLTITPDVSALTATNYSFAAANGTVTVDKAVLTITANAKTVTFGDPVSNVTGTGSYGVLGYKNGENSSVITGLVSYTTSYTATTAAGTSGLTITPDVSALTAANYSFAAANGTVTVDKAVLTITADNQSVAYGTSVATVTTGGTNTPTGFAGSDDATVISGLVSYTTSYTATTAAGTSGLTITPDVSALTATNYSFAAANGTVTVDKAVLTITANAKTVTFGDPVSNVTGTGSYSVLGYKNGENSSVITGTVSYTTNYTTSTPSGASSIYVTPVISGLSADNYSFVASNGTVTVLEQFDWVNLQYPANGTITVGDDYMVYAQAYEGGVTNALGQGAGVQCWIGYSTTNTDPSTWTNWALAAYNTESGNNDEFKANLGTAISTNGAYYYASRFQLGSGSYIYGGYSGGGGGVWNGSTYASGTITVKGISTISVSGAQTYTYNGLAQGPATSTVTGSTGAVTYEYSGTGGTTYVASATKPTAVGTYQVVATLASDANFASAISAAFGFTIDKAATTITVTGLTAFTYTGSAQGPATASVTGSTGTVTYEYSGVLPTVYTASATAPTAVGTYQAVATVVADASYNGATSAAFGFSIDKASTTITVTGLTAFTYTGSAQGPATASVTGSTGAVTYEYSGVLPTVYPASATAPTAVGTYQAVATVAADASYNGATSAALGFTIDKASTSITVTGLTAFTYTGSAQGPATASVTGSTGTITYEYSGVLPTVYTASATAPTAVGTYQAVATVAADASYNGATSAALGFSIDKAATTITVTGLTAFTYSGSAQGPATASVTGSTGTVTYEYSGVLPTVYPASATAPTAVGTYQAVATVAADASYNGATSAALGFTIDKAATTITVTGLTAFTYTGSAQGPATASVTGSTGTVTYSYEGVGGTVYTASATAPTAVGSYEVTATVAADASYNGATSAALGFTIDKASTTITVTGLTAFTYSGSAQGPATASVTGSTGTVTYSYEGVGGTVYTASATAPTAVGSYEVTATVAADANYNGATSAALGFTIDKAATSITVTGLTAFTYSGSAQGPATASVTGSTGTVTYEYSGVLPTVYTASATAPTAVGTYQAVATVAADASYNGATSAALGFTIDKAATTITVTGLTAFTYTGSAQGPATASVTGSTGAVTYEYSGVLPTVYPASATAPTAVGTYQAVATVAADASYNGATSAAFGFTIDKAATSITVTGLTAFTYSGSAQGPATASVTGSTGTVTYEYSGVLPTVYPASATAPTAVGTYQAVATVVADASYNGATSAAFGFSIDKAATTITVTGLTAFTYTGSAQGPATASVTGSTGAVTYEYSGVLPTVYTASATAPTAVGTYQAVATVAADASYNGATSAALGFTIDKASTSITVTGLTAFTYTGSAQGPATASVTGSTGTITYEYSGVLPTVYTASATAPTAVGTYQAVATVAADASYNGATSAALGFSIDKAATTITVTGLTAFTYSGSAQGPATASVTGSTGTVTYEYSGVLPTVYPASATAPTAVGTYQAVATVAADASYNGATSAALGFTIDKAATTITVTGLTAFTYTGSAQGPATASVTGSTGTVTYSYEGVSGTVYTASATAPTAVGTYQAVATVVADASYNGATSAAFGFTIDKAATSITVTGLTAFTYSGSAQGPATASVTGSTGTVTYEYSGVLPTVYPASATAPTAVGTYQAVATVAADANYNGATSAALGFTIDKAATSITVTGLTAFTYTGSAQGPATASVTGSMGTVTYSYEGVSGTVYTASATAPTAVGSYEVTATVAADANYNGAISAAFGFTIDKAATSITVTGLTAFTYTGSAQGPATATVVGSSGSITYEYSGVLPTVYPASATAPTAVGTYQAVATVAADASYNGATSAALGFTIDKAATSITVTGLTAFTYSGSAQGPATASVTGSTGTVTYEYSGVLPTVYPASATAPTAVGTYQAVATVAADASYNGATSAALGFTIDKAATTITVTGLTAFTYTGSAQGPATASVTGSTGTITYEYSGVLPTVYPASATAPTAVGTYQAVATVVADANYNGATSAALGFSIDKANQTISFAALLTKNYGDAPFTVSATGGGSGNPVTFSSSDDNIATCTGTNGTTITIVSSGSCTIYADQAGNSNYDAASQVGQLLTINNGIGAPSNLSYSIPVVFTIGQPIADMLPTVTGTVTNYTINPALPTGLNINATTGIISGIPSVVAAATNYVVTATNANGSTSFQASIEVQSTTDPTPAPANLSYAIPVVFTQGQPIANMFPTVTGTVNTYTAATLPTGLSINATTGIISGTPSVVAAATNYMVTATNANGSTSFQVSIEVQSTTDPTPAPSNLSYSIPVVFTVGQPITNMFPTVTGTVNTYTAATLPTGLNINATTGIISGTPSVVAAATNYMVTATNANGSTSFQVSIEVQSTTDPTPAPANLSYAIPVVFTQGQPIANMFPTVTGTVNTYTAATLPTGLSINATTGIISGTPSVVAAATNYMVTATNANGSTSFQFSIEVQGTTDPTPAPSNLSYSIPVVFTVGQPITNMFPTVTGTVNTYTAATLPTGLNINATTGIISGTPSVVAAATNYMVTATNANGSTSFQVSIEVQSTTDPTPAPANLSYATPVVFTQGQPISDMFPAVTGNVVTYEASALPVGLNINATTGIISGTPLVVTAATNYMVTATNANGSTSFSVNISVNVTKNVQTITFGPLSAKAYGDAAFTVSATGGGSGNPITFTSSNTAIATCSGTNGSTITIVGFGNCIIYANQLGDSNYYDAASESQVLVINNGPGAPSSLSYNSPVTYNVNHAILSEIPVVTGTVTAYAVSPSLPAGLSLDPTSGIISGTPTVVTAKSSYTVTARNIEGKTSFLIWMTISSSTIPGDTNGNGIIDDGEIAGDINGDGKIDNGEVAGDANGDGKITSPEIAGDTNGDGKIDNGEITGDTNGDGKIDNGEIAGDKDGDGKITSPEITGDTNGDGKIDNGEVAGDKDGDGKITSPEITGDTNGDGKIDNGEIAGDKDGDGKITSPEIAGDTNGDGKIDNGEIAGDKDGDGKITSPEIAGDTNGDGKIDNGEIAGDKDGDGKITSPEIAGDTNGDGKIDNGEIAGDKDGDGKITSPEIAGDTNGDGKIDSGEIAGDKDGDGKITSPEIVGDTNGDGKIDNGEIAGDKDGDGKITSPEIAGDTNGDGKIDNSEIAGDKDGDGKITSPEIAGDINGDGKITKPEVGGDANGNGVIDGKETYLVTVLSKVDWAVPFELCENSEGDLEFTILSGTPAEYKITFDAAALVAGFKNVDYTKLVDNDIVSFNVIDGTPNGTYHGTLTFRNAVGAESEGYPFQFIVNLSSKYIIQKFDDVVLCDNSSNRFTAYQWYKNGEAVVGATKQFYCDPNGLVGFYSLEVTDKSGQKLNTCGLELNIPVIKKVSIYPNPVNVNQTCTVELTGFDAQELDGSVLSIFNSAGSRVYYSDKVNQINSVKLPFTPGIYIGHVTSAIGTDRVFKVILK